MEKLSLIFSFPGSTSETRWLSPLIAIYLHREVKRARFAAVLQCKEIITILRTSNPWRDAAALQIHSIAKLVRWCGAHLFLCSIDVHGHTFTIAHRNLHVRYEWNKPRGWETRSLDLDRRIGCAQPRAVGLTDQNPMQCPTIFRSKKHIIERVLDHKYVITLKNSKENKQDTMVNFMLDSCNTFPCFASTMNRVPFYHSDFQHETNIVQNSDIRSIGRPTHVIWVARQRNCEWELWLIDC